MKKMLIVLVVLAVAGIANGTLIANFPLNQSSGTTFTETVSSNDGTLGDGGNGYNNWVNIGSRYALNMNVLDATATAPNAAILGIETTDKMTISFWAKGVGLPTAPCLIMDTGDSYIHQPYWLGTWGVSNWSHSMNPQQYTEVTVANADFELWHMWSFTKDSATGDVDIFMDGVSLGANWGNGDAAIENTTDFYLNGTGSEPYEGLIAEVQVWDSVMTSAEMTAAYDAGIASGIPEPMTIALLGLGGLFLRKRK